MLKHIFAWLLVLLAAGGIAGSLGVYKYNEIQRAVAASGAAPEPVESVVAVRARDGTWTRTTRAIGSVVALRHVEIRNEIAGVISEIGFKSGDRVAQGALLVKLDTRQEEAALAAAEADARLAKLTLERRESLRSSAAFNPQELDRSREEHAAAEARARNLAVIVDKKRITAPFHARVGITNWQPGAYLDAGTLIVTLQGTDTDAYVDFTLPQDSAASVRTDTEIRLSGPAVPGGGTAATIMAEDNAADGTNRAVQFRAVATGFGERLRPGTFVDVTVETGAPQRAVMIPLAALRRSPAGQHVFVLVTEEGKLRARQRTVETGPVQGNDIAVEKGLAAGELIAASGSFKLREGLLVETTLPDAAPAAEIGVN